ncbi:hypothetical protein amrb99_79150 [Actinomadura sp. RB99]|uniref:SPW repeat domain-containing protein n=1 Tax=Actinomadura sp. RB99 TaxID=2691577 RepID=UPI001688C67D|nr:SPW repeat protein [Actinomadura sp. RB99]MBD2898938.1 hypothetical protein [Actinomadura sp. RB99]
MDRFAWQDGVAFAAGLVVLVAPELWGDNAGEQPLMVLGALLMTAGLWALLGGQGVPSWAATAFALLIFVAPWAFGFTGAHAPAWTAWIAGGAAAIVGLWGATQAHGGKPAAA